MELKNESVCEALNQGQRFEELLLKADIKSVCRVETIMKGSVMSVMACAQNHGATCLTV